MDTLFDNHLKKTILNFSIENDYRFFIPKGKRKYQFKHLSKVPKDATILDNKDYQYLSSTNNIYNSNWSIAEANNKLFEYCVKNIDPQYKKELYEKYGFFNQLKDIISFFIFKKDILEAKNAFSLTSVHIDKFRSAKEEEEMLCSLYDIYTNKKEFINDLQLYLIHHKSQYTQGVERTQKEFMLYGFLEEHFNFEDTKKIRDLLPYRFKELETSSVFENYERTIEPIIIKNQNFYNNVKIEGIKKSDLYDAYQRILNYISDYIDTEFRTKGITKFSNAYHDDYGINMKEHTVYHMHITQDATISKQEITKFFLSASQYLGENYCLIQKKIEDKVENKKYITQLLFKFSLDFELDKKNKNKRAKI